MLHVNETSKDEWDRYVCTHGEALSLIKWLLAKHYWFDVYYSGAEYHVKCNLLPREIPKKLKLKVEEAK